MDLREWTVLYVRHKHLGRQLLGQKEEDGKLVFAFTDHELHVLSQEQLAVPAVGGKTMLATLNTLANIEFLIAHWQEFAAIERLTIIFVNPATDEKWFIVPHTHAQVSDPDIEQGIRALAENVTTVA